jgi:methionine-rich copper-binding protein CopC
MLTILLLCLFVPSALAHSGLETSNPHDGEVVNDELSTLSLTFNTMIESTSTFKLFKEDGQEVPLAELVVNEKDMVGNLSSPLEDGKYSVTWKIIGEDGHPIENSYSFSVATSNDTNAEVTSEWSAEENNNETSIDVTEIIEKEAPSSNNILIVIVILLIVIALGSTFWLLKRGKK